MQLACNEAPDGHDRWSLRMLADKLIELEVVETVSRETVRTTLKKMNLSLDFIYIYAEVLQHPHVKSHNLEAHYNFHDVTTKRVESKVKSRGTYQAVQCTHCRLYPDDSLSKCPTAGF